MKIIYSYLVLAIIACLPFKILAQSNALIDRNDGYYHRILQVSGLSQSNYSFNLRPYDFSVNSTKEHPWKQFTDKYKTQNFFPNDSFDLELYSPILFQSYNSTLPRGNQDGAMWQGKGYNTAFSTGFQLKKGIFRVQFIPEVGFTQNSDIYLGPYSPPEDYNEMGNFLSEYAYRDFRGSIDYVQRYGGESFTWASLGQSFVDFHYKGFRVALTNERHWTGPAINTSLQMGYSAPGFKHVYVGTYHPIQTPAGSFEFAYIFGGTKESDYFDEIPENNLQSINSLTFVYSPWFAKHFSIGGVRTFFHSFPSDFSQYKHQAAKLFQAVTKNKLKTPDNPTGISTDNQVISVFLRYYIPVYRFEVYSEFGRNDHNLDLRDFRAQPDHQRAYTLGLTKTFDLTQGRLLAINFEMNQLETNRTSLTRGGEHLGGWYTHGSQVHGYTNNGQILGTGYGPGVNVQMVRGDLFDQQGKLSLKLGRIVYHNSRLDQYFGFIQAANEEKVEPWEVRNIEYMIGMEKKAFLPNGFEISGALEPSYILNHHNLKGNDKFNLRFEVVVRKNIAGWRR